MKNLDKNSEQFKRELLSAFLISEGNRIKNENESIDLFLSLNKTNFYSIIDELGITKDEVLDSIKEHIWFRTYEKEN